MVAAQGDHNVALGRGGVCFALEAFDPTSDLAQIVDLGVVVWTRGRAYGGDIALVLDEKSQIVQGLGQACGAISVGAHQAASPVGPGLHGHPDHGACGEGLRVFHAEKHRNPLVRKTLRKVIKMIILLLTLNSIWQK